MMTESTSQLHGKHIKSENYHGSRGMFFVNVIPLTFFYILLMSMIVGTSGLLAPGMSLAAEEVVEVLSGSQVTEVLVPLWVHTSLGSTTTTPSMSINEPGNTELEAPQILAVSRPVQL